MYLLSNHMQSTQESYKSINVSKI